MRRAPLLPLFFVVAVCVGLALVLPVWRGPTSLAPDTQFTDGHLLAIAAWGTPMAHGRLPALSTPLVGWPRGADLRPLLWPSTLLGALVGPPLALDLTFAGVPAFNLVCGWILGGVLGRGEAGRVLLGALLAFHPWVLETLRNGQVEQAVLGGAALQLAAAIWAMAPASRAVVAVRVGALAAITAAVGWAAPHVALAGCVVVGVWVLVGSAGSGVPRRALIVLAVALGALAVRAYHAPSFDPVQHVFSPKGSDGRPTELGDLPEVATLARLFLPPRASTAPVVHPNYLGGILLLSALAAARRDRTARVGLGVAAALSVLALGPALSLGSLTIPLPWAALPALSATVARSMSAYRMLIGAVVALAAAASALPMRTFGVAGLVAAALLETAAVATRPLVTPAATVFRDGDAAALVAGAGPVLDLPIAGPGCPTGAGHYLLQAVLHDRPVPLLLSNPRAGYAAVPNLVTELAQPWGRSECSTRIAGDIKRWAFTTVVLHEHDAACPVPAKMAGCLEAALGPGESGEGVRWWATR